MSTPVGDGDYSATPLAGVGSGEVGLSSGSAEASYPIEVPPSTAGPVPAPSLTYSSAAVDGLSTDRNTQSSQVGIGWNFNVGSIDRQYKACGGGVGDQCWAGENYTITLNGVTDELIAVPFSGGAWWRLKNDPDWEVTRVLVPDLVSLDHTQADKGAYFVVKSPDGTEYRFGRLIDSLWYSQVVHFNGFDPCFNFPNRICTQGWRWALDQVTDPYGNTISYHYDTGINYYKPLMGLIVPPYTWKDFPYVMWGRLNRIEYSSTGTTSPHQKVVAWYSDRCTGNCSTLEYPDTPWDLLCPLTASDCSVSSPTFWTAQRLSGFTTHVIDSGTTWSPPIRTYALSHSYPTPPIVAGEPASFPKMQLDTIQRQGEAGGLIPEPTRYGYGFKNNRVTFGTLPPVSAMQAARLTTITSELGGQQVFWYGQPFPCASGATYFFNVEHRDCFPAWDGSGSLATFIPSNKWIVVQTTNVDLAGASTTQNTLYEYPEGPQWHYSTSRVLPEHDAPPASPPQPTKNWNDYRGHQKVNVIDVLTGFHTDHRFYTGMHGDRADDAVPPNTRTVTFTNFDNSVQTDWHYLAGREAGSQRIDANLMGEQKMTDYFADLTAGPAETYWPNADQQAHFVAPAKEDTVSLGSPSEGAKTSRTTYDYNVYAQGQVPTATNQLSAPKYEGHQGDASIATDNWHIDRTFAFGTITDPLGSGAQKVPFRGLVATEYVRTGLPAGTGTTIAHTEYRYDNTAVGSLGTAGSLTHTIQYTTASASSTTLTAYDNRGRESSTTDPLGHSTTYSYDSVLGAAKRVTVTNVANHQVITDSNPHFGVPTTITDPNGHPTTLTYDEFGRLSKVWLPTEPTTGSPSKHFEYRLWDNDNKPSRVKTRIPNAPVDQVTYEFLDGFGRSLQTDTLSPKVNSTRSRTSTTYDAVGRVLRKSAPYEIGGDPDTGEYIAPVWANIPTWEIYSFDVLNRVVRDSHHSNNGPPLWDSVTSYDAWNKRVTPDEADPTSMTEYRSDGHGNLASVGERNGSLFGVPTFMNTNYTYDASRHLTTISDTAGNVTTNTWDLAGRKTAMNDPDAGAWSYVYDAAGNLTQQTSATNKTVVFKYDTLNRLTEKRQDTATGPLIASYSYDATGYKGLPDTSTSYDGANAYSTKILAYDGRNRPLTKQWTIPAAATGVSGTYKMAYSYDPADHLLTVQYPGGSTGTLGETVTTGYNSAGYPTTLTGTNTYVNASGYNASGQLTSQTLGSSTIARSASYDTATQRLTALKAGTGGSTTNQQNLTYAYDNQSNVTSTTDANDASQRQCFTYDDFNRLTHAFTGNDACTTYDGTRGTSAYDQSFAYDTVGNFTSAAGRTYTYGDPAHKHAPTLVGSDGFSYDANGSQIGRTVGGTGALLGYDYLNRLNIVGSTVTSNYVYDADGNRLIRQDGTTRTLYLEGGDYQRSSVNGAAATVTTYYKIGSQRAAVRKGSSLYYELPDHLASASTTYKSDGTSTVKQRYYPFGAIRPGPGNNLPVDETFLGKTRDATTGLTQMGARYYDPGIGRFVSIDPVATPDQPQSLNAYSYALNNPTTLSDPDGTCICNEPGWHQHSAGSGSSDAIPTPSQFIANLKDKGYIKPAVYSNRTINRLLANREVRKALIQLRIFPDARTFENPCSGRFGTWAGPCRGSTGGISYWDHANDTLTEAAFAALVASAFLFSPTQHSGGHEDAPAAQEALPELSTDSAQLEAKFKHAADFGVTEPRGAAGFEAYGKAVDTFVSDPETVRVAGTYRGDAAILNYNPSTAHVVVQAPDGSFVSGWQMSPAQLQNVIARGSLGGG